MTEEKVGSVNDEEQIQEKKDGGGVNLGRHQAQCTICLSPNRQQIDEDWINWHHPGHFKDAFGVSRDTLYRHAHATGLFSKRRKNVSMVLEKMIERVDWAPVSGSVILSAIKVLEKINRAGQEGEPVHETDPKVLLKRMSPEERQQFVQDGSLPEWFSEANGTTPCQSQEGDKTSPVTEAQKLQ